jgi:hypothetical protein
MADVMQKKKKICKFSICPLTYEDLDPKYHSRNKRNVLKYIYDYEQANNKVFTGLLTSKIDQMLGKRLTCIQVRKYRNIDKNRNITII